MSKKADETARMLTQCPTHACSGDRQTPHPCPFKAEIHNDEESLCECCDNCTYQCAMDI